MLHKDNKKHSPKATLNSGRLHNGALSSPDAKAAEKIKEVVDIGYVTFFPSLDTAVAESIKKVADEPS